MADKRIGLVTIHGSEHLSRTVNDRTQPVRETVEEILARESIRLGVPLEVVKKEGSE
jgi:hypothetical protein